MFRERFSVLDLMIIIFSVQLCLHFSYDLDWNQILNWGLRAGGKHYNDIAMWILVFMLITIMLEFYFYFERKFLEINMKQQIDSLISLFIVSCILMPFDIYLSGDFFYNGVGIPVLLMLLSPIILRIYILGKIGKLRKVIILCFSIVACLLLLLCLLLFIGIYPLDILYFVL